MRELSNYDQFQDTISISERNVNEQYDMELLLRFIIFSKIEMDSFGKTSDIGQYLTSKMIEIAKDKKFNADFSEKQFKAVFNLLSNTTGSNSFKRFNDGKFKGGFLLSPFEVIACGLGYNYPDNLPSPEKIFKEVERMYSNDEYIKCSGSGIPARYRLPRLLPLGRKIFSK